MRAVRRREYLGLGLIRAARFWALLIRECKCEGGFKKSKLNKSKTIFTQLHARRTWNLHWRLRVEKFARYDQVRQLRATRNWELSLFARYHKTSNLHGITTCCSQLPLTTLLSSIYICQFSPGRDISAPPHHVCIASSNRPVLELLITTIHYLKLSLRILIVLY
jgi:hypothetical protein